MRGLRVSLYNSLGEQLTQRQGIMRGLRVSLYNSPGGTINPETGNYETPASILI